MGGEAPFGGCIIFVDLQQFCLTNDAPLNENPFLSEKKGFCVLPGYSSVDGFPRCVQLQNSASHVHSEFLPPFALVRVFTFSCCKHFYHWVLS